jgi:thymidylate kinase
MSESDSIHNLLMFSVAGSKITVVEGPDGAGKTTAIRRLKEEYGEDLIVLRCPDNRGKSTIRDILLNDPFEDSPVTQKLLFAADFALLFDRDIKPHLDKPNVRFVLDRFIPSTIVYQGLDLSELQHLDFLWTDEMTQACSQMVYVYLIPTVEVAIARLTKRAEERNHLDSVDEAVVKSRIDAYTWMAELQRDMGLMGSKIAHIHRVTAIL